MDRVARDILASDATIVIEVVGGIRPAYDWVKGALQPASRWSPPTSN